MKTRPGASAGWLCFQSTITNQSAGLLFAGVLAQSIDAFLFGVRPVDPVTFAAVLVVLGVTASIAAAVPALRAARTDPVQAFRGE